MFRRNSAYLQKNNDPNDPKIVRIYSRSDVNPIRRAPKRWARSGVSPIRCGLYNMYEECLISCGAVERLTDLKAKRFLDDFKTLSENQQEDLLLLLHGAVGLQGDEGKGKKIKKKGGSDSKAKKKTKANSKAAEGKRYSFSEATAKKNVTTSPQHGNTDPSTPGKNKPPTRKILQPGIL